MIQLEGVVRQKENSPSFKLLTRSVEYLEYLGHDLLKETTVLSFSGTLWKLSAT